MGNIKMALFTGVFVGIVMFFFEYLISDVNIVIKVLIAGLSALVGGLLGNKLFPHKSQE